MTPQSYTVSHLLNDMYRYRVNRLYVVGHLPTIEVPLEMLSQLVLDGLSHWRSLIVASGSCGPTLRASETGMGPEEVCAVAASDWASGWHGRPLHPDHGQTMDKSTPTAYAAKLAK